MDGGDLGKNHGIIKGSSGDRLSADSLPLIDTRLLSQSELLALSHCSSLSPSSIASLAASAGVDDDLTPKIDRSVFNESAGSRKQTFLRLRLARHPPPPRPPSPQRQQRDDSSREENLQVASLLRSLLCVDSNQRKPEEEEDEEPEENEGQPLFPIPIHNNGNVYQNPNLDSIKNLLIQGTGKRRGRPRKIRNPSDVLVDFERAGPVSVDKTCSNLGTESRFDDSGIITMDPNSSKRKRGRPRKSGDSFNQSISEDREENREGTMVNLFALANYEEDPYGEELRRITLGLKTKEELSGFLQQLNGEWVNAGKKKKKVMEACDCGGYFPKGWKLMLCIRKKGSNLWLACRKYVSPNGQEFETCKEVSAYLQSLLDSRGKNQLNALQSDNKTLGQAVMMANECLVGNSGSIDLPDSKAETNQNLVSKRTNSEVFEEANGTENSDIIEPVKSSLVEKDGKGIPTAESLNGDNKDNMKKRDDNMENLAVPSNSRAQSEEFIRDLPWTTEEIQRIWGSRNP